MAGGPLWRADFTSFLQLRKSRFLFFTGSLGGVFGIDLNCLPVYRLRAVSVAWKADKNQRGEHNRCPFDDLFPPQSGLIRAISVRGRGFCG